KANGQQPVARIVAMAAHAQEPAKFTVAPIGASGTHIIVTLLNALKRQGKTRGIASLCIGGGEATAIAVELV
ncbi:MAG: hypothetical protein KKH37_10005, partial [Alphaproteobacteria bacterium]|nr:hypothetical protein [Alphaproteobacteria bacterium]